jgi:signal peptidase II
LKRSFHDYVFLGTIAGTILIVDQISKLLVRTYLPINHSWAPWDWMLPYVRLFHTQNTGVAFGMFQGANLLVAILAVIISVAIIIYFPRVPKTDWTLRVALSMQLAGAMGNLLDRIFVGQVTDFISVGNFAVFNIADSSITIGVVVLLVGVWLQERKQKNKLAEKSPIGDEPLNPETPKSPEKLRIDESHHE